MKQEKICFNCFCGLPDRGRVCPHCGYDPDREKESYPMALPPGSILAGQYIVGRVLGQGGFGITYLAQDWRLKIKIAIKEFLPEMMAIRMAGSSEVIAYSGKVEENFRYGKQQFLEEARTLARFSKNANIARIWNYFEENGTAYFVMEYIDGHSFKEYIRSRGGRVSCQEALSVLTPVMRALEEVHGEGIIHRDVTPDNIFITKDGNIKLLDFGAARYSLGDRSRSLDVVLTAGYAPKEQYSRNGRQGPYTDVYSVAACFYAAITGCLPPESLERAEEDDLVPPSARGLWIPERLEDAVLKGLEINARDRFQTMGEFLGALDGLLDADAQAAADSYKGADFYKDRDAYAGTDVRRNADSQLNPSPPENKTLRTDTGRGEKEAQAEKGKAETARPGSLRRPGEWKASFLVLCVVAAGIVTGSFIGFLLPGPPEETALSKIVDNRWNDTALRTQPEGMNRGRDVEEAELFLSSLQENGRKTALGNTMGNLNNGGWVVEVKGEGETSIHLYRYGKFHNHMNGWDYYCVDNTMYREQTEDGSGEAELLLELPEGGVFENLAVTEDWIVFCMEKGEKHFLFRIDSELSGTAELLAGDDNNGHDFIVEDGWLYYWATDRNLYRLRMDGTEKTQILKGFGISPCVMDGIIYYADGSSLCRVQRGGSGKVLAESEAAGGIYNVNARDGWIYYDVSYDSGAEIRRVRADGTQMQILYSDKECRVMELCAAAPGLYFRGIVDGKLDYYELPFTGGTPEPVFEK